MGSGVVLWTAAVLSQCVDGNPRSAVSIAGFGFVLLLLGVWMVRPSRRSVMADRSVDAPPLTAIWMAESSAVQLRKSKYDIRMFEISIGERRVVHLSRGVNEENPCVTGTRRPPLLDI